jgi:hypothetical protein
MKAPGFAICLLLAFGGPAWAQSLQDRQVHQKFETALASEVADTNKACGSEIKAGFDWPSFKSEDLGKYGVAGYCANALSAVRQVCGVSGGKEAVQKAVKELVCASGAKRDIALKDGKLTFTIEWTASNDEDAVKAFLMKNL